MSEKYSMLKPYEGDGNYIFISYSHADSGRVLPLLAKMSNEGFRIWYDEGIDPGSEWPESIANHLRGCKVLMAFLSNNSLASKNCKREINYALSLDKDFLSVALEPVQMSPGMEMQISSYQSLLSYKYPSEKEFEEKLMSLELIQSCREVIVHEVTEDHFDFVEDFRKDEESKPQEETAAKVTETDKVQKKGEKKQKKAEIKQKKKTSSAGSGSARKSKLPIVLLAVVAIIAFILFPKGGKSSSSHKLVIGDKTYKDALSVFIDDVDFTVDQLKTLSEFEEVRYLYFTDCSFPDSGLKQLSALSSMRTFEFKNCQGISDISFMNEMSGLESLLMTDCSLNDAAFSGVELNTVRKLDLSGNELTVIPELGNYTSIFMDGNKLTDLSGLTGISTLERASFSGNQITDISGISDNEKLVYLNLNDNKITDISTLESLVYLKNLYLRNNDITDTTPLRYTSVLQELNLGGNPKISDLSFLENNTASLKVLNIMGIDAGSISYFNRMNNMEALWISGCNISDLSFAATMPNLQILNASDNYITSVEPLRSLTSLEVINLANNGLASLNGLPQGKNRMTLLLNGNKLTSLSGLQSAITYSLITLYGNPLTDTSAINDIDGYQLIIDMSEAYDPAMLKKFAGVYVTEKDLALQVAWESALGTSRLQYKTLEDAWNKALSYGNLSNKVNVSY